jgi:hypothetical protein
MSVFWLIKLVNAFVSRCISDKNEFKSITAAPESFTCILLVGSELLTIRIPTASDLSIDYLSKAGSMATGNENYQINICNTRYYFNGNIKHVWNME